MQKRNQKIDSRAGRFDREIALQGAKQEIKILLSTGEVDVCSDPYSDRIRCDHPKVKNSERLGNALLEKADELGRARVVVMADEKHREGLLSSGLNEEACIPGFYQGENDCVVMGAALEEDREGLARPEKVAKVLSLIRQDEGRSRQHANLQTERASTVDAEEIAALLGKIFDAYPTPSHNPNYVRKQIEDGIPFRVVRKNGEIMACASADLVAEAKTAELTDCVTRPDARGKGIMQSILFQLMDDLRAMGFPTVFTLARATIPGINLAFNRIGFEFRGTMGKSCRIGSGIEDMNVWSRRL